MEYLEYAVAIAFCAAGLWFGIANLQARSRGSIPVDIGGQRVELLEASEPEKFRSALLFQALTALGSLAIGAALLAMKISGL